MKKKLFSKIKIRIVTTIYIVCAMSGALSGALCSALYGALSGNCRALHSTPKKSSVFMIFSGIKTLPTAHKKEGFMGYKLNNMSRQIGFYLPFWPGLFAHPERKASNELRPNTIIYEHLY